MNEPVGASAAGFECAHGGRVTKRLNVIGREARLKNEISFALSFFPNGQGKKPKPLVVLENDTIQICAVKKAHTSNNIVVRLFEAAGRKRTAVLSQPAIGKRLKVQLGPFEIKILKINLKTREIVETDLLERNLARQNIK